MNTTSEARGASGDPESIGTIEREIDETRKALDETIEALETKLSPRQRLESAKSSLREGTSRAMSTGMRAILPGITAMIRTDHTHVRALFRRFKSHTSPGRKRALVENACLALDIHARLEEDIFYPRLREAVGSHPILDNSVAEHDADEETVLLPLAEEVLADELIPLGMEMSKRRIQLLRPHARDLAVTSIKSFPVAFGALAAGVVVAGWLAARALRPPRT
jgi:hypothetical protein